MRNVLQKKIQEVRSSYNFELPLNGPAKKIHNKNNFFFSWKGKKYVKYK